MKPILFLCVANSARSQMAEGIARKIGPARLKVFSAGSRPGQVNPLAVQVMGEIGIDISKHRAKGLDAVPLDRIGTVVTLCGEEICPVAPGKQIRVNWPLPDPAAVRGSHETRLRAFRRARTELRWRIGQLLDALR